MEMELLAALTGAVGTLLKAFSGYFIAIALFAFFKERGFKRSPPKTRFAALIAARNEEAVISGIVESLKNQDYPPELCDIYVIPNNCKDGTETAALAAGAKIIRCRRPVRYKGDALNQAFEELANMEYDAFCVFDADNIASPAFLSEMNDAFASGALVCKGRRMAKNPYDSATAGCYAIYFELFNIFFNRARSRLGLSAKIDGTGFAVTRKAVEILGGWKTSAITEDAEFAAQLAYAGIRVAWVPRAVTYDEQPTSPPESVIQRMRWCSGLIDVAKLRLPALLSRRRAAPRAGAGERCLRFDSFMILISPVIQLVSLIPAILAPVFRLLSGKLEILPVLAALAVLYTVVAAFAAALSAYAGYGLRRMARSVPAFPLFMASWLPILVAAFFRRTSSWREMRRAAALPQRAEERRRAAPRAPVARGA
ncbi:MAG: glycosyltransferase family 2 protein [Oscillospiraceae bacterium]|jgi:cellulose synthase/poly-beta-1,6-N-acetylglucosamine synthase-like glycosyltransferase|nr:glycosyltransferase family 2 protein [Oscillospiraceae bacterium]